MLTAFTPPAGVTNDGTAYSVRGTWHDCDKVRFRGSFPEKIGGWQQINAGSPFLGVCRCMHQWADLSFQKHLALGTNLKFYIDTEGSLNDVTPIRRTVTLGSAPFATTNLSPTITVSDVAHGAIPGDRVTFTSATAVAGFTTAQLNVEQTIVSVPNGDSYTFTLGTNANATTTGGGTPSAAYQINTGLADRVSGGGWDAGAWGRGGWGDGTSLTVLGNQIRVWTADNFGEDLLFCQRGGDIYYWEANSPGRGVSLSTTLGATDVPTVANVVLASPDDRRTFAFGCNDYGAAILDPLLIRWSAAGTINNFTPSATADAGFIRLAVGSEIIAAHEAKSELLVWTDTSLTSLTFVGGDAAYSPTLVSPRCDIIGPKAATCVDDLVFWMGRNSFYYYDGRVQSLPCSVKRKVFDDLNLAQSYKVYCSTNSMFREVVWFYPSLNSLECDKYVAYNYETQVWYFGTMPRTAWIDFGTQVYQPRACDPNGFYYYHESGYDDGSTSPPSPIAAYIESAPFELAGTVVMTVYGDGNKMVFCSRIVPDITFENSTVSNPQCTYTLKPQDYPGSPQVDIESGATVQQVVSPVEQWTTKLDMRLRARQFALRVSSADLGVAWRLGVQRFDIQPDGGR